MELKEKSFAKDKLWLDNIELCCENMVRQLKHDVVHDLGRRGAIIGISGGIDSSVTLALSVRAFGEENVVGLIMPERDSSDESISLAQKLASEFNVRTIIEDLTPALEGFGCYQRRDEAISRVIPTFNPKKDKTKIILNTSIENSIPSVFSVAVIKPNGNKETKLLPVKEYLQIVAATNFKQRSRMSMLYYHAERLHYAVIGTPNKHEVEQGFFVKYGDGGADVMPIGNLYKTQVYQMAEYLGIPQEIIQRTPTTDTYTAEQTQEEFFYQLPFETMDLLWHAWENKLEAEELANYLGKSISDIQNVFKTFQRKQKTTEYLRRAPIFH